MQSDSHQGFQAFYSSALYGITLQNVLNDQPDLLFDLGDSVGTDLASETATTVNQKYAAQRSFFDTVAHSTPIFLVLGNHENEEGWNLDDFGADIQNSLPVLGANGRKRYFANPVPDGFYTGNTDPLPQIDGDHLRGDYYAFEWGSALFVAIDPFWYTTVKPYAGSTGGEKDDEVVGSRWDWTLGKAQYDWLDRTLANSSAPFKFVFAHHMTGGTSDYVRGGARGAKYCEWGGYDIDGTTFTFDSHRPGWALPVHDLLSERGVTAFFHGHDHVFAREELDGVVYQECPHAANPDYGSGFATNASDYAGAVVVNNSGHLRVTVSPALVTVEYVRAYLPGDGTNGSVAYSYTISPCTALGSDGHACDDGNRCTEGDHCAGGSCQPGTASSCDDGNGCTDDACSSALGCVHVNNAAPCSDGDACTTGDACHDGMCTGHAVACEPSDACHVAGVCDPSTGACSKPPVMDGTPCAGGTCSAGICTPTSQGGASGGAGYAGAAGSSAGAAGSGGVTGTSGAAGASASGGNSGIAGIGGVDAISGVGGIGAVGGIGGVGGAPGSAAGEAGIGEDGGRDGARGGTSFGRGGSHAAAGGREQGEAGTLGEGAEGGEVAAATSGRASGGRANTGGYGGGAAGRAGGTALVSGEGGAPYAAVKNQRSGCACRVMEQRDAREGAWGAALCLALGFVRRRRARSAD